LLLTARYLRAVIFIAFRQAIVDECCFLGNAFSRLAREIPVRFHEIREYGRTCIKIGAGCDDIGVEIKQIRHVHILCISNLFFKNIRNKTLTRYLQRDFSYLILFRDKRESDTRFINERFYSSLETHLIEIR